MGEPEAKTEAKPEVSLEDFEALKVELEKVKQEAADDKKRLNDEAAKRRLETKQTKEDADKSLTELQKELRLRDAAVALKDAGVTGKSPALLKAAKLLDSTDPDELEGSIARLKADFPGMFSAVPEKKETDDEEEKPKPPRIKTGNQLKPKEGVDPNSMEAVVDALMGRRKPGVRKG